MRECLLQPRHRPGADPRHMPSHHEHSPNRLRFATFGKNSTCSLHRQLATAKLGLVIKATKGAAQPQISTWAYRPLAANRATG